MKILVVYTGGTIGSSKANGVVAPNENTKGELISRYNSEYGGDICFCEMSPLTILSENLSAEVINNLIKIALDNVNAYDGIIFTHGTDTLSYSACALSLALGECNPVVLVSSNYPLEDERANGYDNFVGAVELIKSGKSKGVFVAYKNATENVRYHRGDRVMLHNAYTDAVESLLGEPYAEYSYGDVNILNPSQIAPQGLRELNLAHNSGVLAIFAHPGDNFAYSLDGVRAVIITTYHSGTLNTANEGFVDFCKRARQKKVGVYAFNVPNGNIYESAVLYDELGIKVLPVCTFPYAYIKLWQNPNVEL